MVDLFHPELSYDLLSLYKDCYLFIFVEGPKSFPFSNRLRILNFGVNVEPKLFEEQVVNAQGPPNETSQ